MMKQLPGLHLYSWYYCHKLQLKVSGVLPNVTVLEASGASNALSSLDFTQFTFLLCQNASELSEHYSESSIQAPNPGINMLPLLVLNNLIPTAAVDSALLN